ncbi:hypothetical protein BJX99DRAFT_254627 [Aspergillus californicus]
MSKENPTPAETRRELLTRHGLIVDASDPNKISLLVDVPSGPKEYTEYSGPVDDWMRQYHFCLLDSALFVIRDRLRCHEFCNPFGNPKDDHSRIIVTVTTDEDTAYAIYKHVEKRLEELKEKSRTVELRGGGEPEYIVEGDITVDVVASESEGNKFWAGIKPLESRKKG